jgi:hypothetical protein
MEKEYSSRMESALKQADQCWQKAVSVAPDFVERYLVLCEELLTSKYEVQGDEFRSYCRAKGLKLDPLLHHNTWVSMK